MAERVIQIDIIAGDRRHSVCQFSQAVSNTKNEFAMEIQISKLLGTKRTTSHAGRDVPSRQDRSGQLWRDQQFPFVTERNETLVKKMVQMRTKQEAIVSVEFLEIRARPPRFNVACAKMPKFRQSRDPARRFESLKIFAIDSLPPPRLDQLCPFGSSNVCSLKNLICNCLIRVVEIGVGRCQRLSFKLGPLSPKKAPQGCGHRGVYL
jgi:hypothetical protein